ncbi:MAG: hypothetical protein UW99_C0033G0002 [Candidatus Collierbacteria bacterium GW2011_GWC2_45_15]|uniref:DUF11 domain-containing protein n=1 Tax=Candidatus Collierbacteria bacterium GW2011_GWC2_45_15 TaxID=1618394 RepID=A0A0G1LNK7_9BACT|nr:MAG: hypothetical protein UW99_C0033G0002 [Candidatus Collierbacteria bacterium GW2011_GWC2_45_15]
MRNRRNTIAIILLLAILLLGGVTVFVAYRISTQVAVAPTAPVSEPAAAISCTTSGGVCRAGTTCPTGQSKLTGADCAVGQSCCIPQWTGSEACKMTFNVLPPACTPRPLCLDTTPPCLSPVPAGGYCPALVCPEGKTVYKDVAGNTPGSYNMDAVNRIANGSSVVPGQTFIYAIEYNSESGTVESAVIDDLLNSKLDFVDSTPECAKQTGSNRVLCNITKNHITAVQTAGTPGKVAIRVKVKENATPGTLPNAATISSTYIAGADASRSNTSKSLCDNTLNISIAPTVAVACKSKVALNSAGTTMINTVGENETFLYSLDVSNTGNAAASEVVVTDTLAAGKLVFVDSDSGCTYSESTRVVTCNTSLNAGETKKITFRVKTSADLTDGETISNTASAKLPITSSTAAGSECTKALKVALPILAATKEAYKDNTNNTPGNYELTEAITTVAKNQTFTYAIAITNSGTGTASGIIINDPLTGQNQDQLAFVDSDIKCDWTAAEKLIRCAADIQPGASGNVAFRVKVADTAVNGQVIQNAGVVSHQGTDINVSKSLTVSTVVACNSTCTTNAECESGFTCDTTASKCRNSQCTTEESCVTYSCTYGPTYSCTYSSNGDRSSHSCSHGRTYSCTCNRRSTT